MAFSDLRHDTIPVSLLTDIERQELHLQTLVREHLHQLLASLHLDIAYDHGSALSCHQRDGRGT